MKRLLCMLLSILMLFSLAACRDGGISPEHGASDGGGTGGADTFVETPLKIMSFNMQTGGEESVANRAPLAVATITGFDADIVGAQEINCFWIDELESLGFFETYTMIGEARMGEDRIASNEYSCVFYKTALFDLIDSGTYWLSNTPEKISKLPSSDYYRIMSYAVLERKSDGKRFVQVSTHLEWNHSPSQPVNLDQTEILLDLLNGIIEEDIPVILAGDFNEPPTSAGYAEIMASGYEDARTVAAQSSNACTFFDGYRGEMTDPDSEGTIIDYCFVSSGDFSVQTFFVGTSCEASDHFPVFAEMTFNPTKKK